MLRHIQSCRRRVICRWYQRRLRKTEKLCFFIGGARSGTTMLNAMLNAHPHIAMGVEYGLHTKMQCDDRKWRAVLGDLLFVTERHFKNGHLASSGSRLPASLFQNAVANPRVVGDKNAARLAEHALQFGPEAFDAHADWPQHFIHLMRNPYDVIATMCRRRSAEKWLAMPLISQQRAPHVLGEQPDPMREIIARGERELQNGDQLVYAAARLFIRAEGVLLMKRHGKYPMLDLHYARITQDTRAEMRRLIEWLGLACDDAYLSACERFVGPTSRTREQIEHLLSDDVRGLIDEQIRRFDFLRGYGWDSDAPADEVMS